jgi:hypothetical protein
LQVDGRGRRPLVHPVALGGVAYVADAGRVQGFDLRTREPRFSYALPGQAPRGRVFGAPPPVPPPEAHHTLTAAGGRLYARLGAPAAAEPGGRPAVSVLACFAPPEAGGALGLRWQLPPPAPARATAEWEGAPVVAGGRVYAAVARADGNRLVHAVACYDDPPADPVWVTDVADGPNPDAGRPRRSC